MKQNRLFMKVAFVSLIALIALACNALAGGITPPSSPVVAATSKFNTGATDAPLSTETGNSATPMPVNIGETVQIGSLEITVLKFDNHNLIVPGGKKYFYAKSGYAFLDLGVIVKNTNSGNPINLAWNTIYIAEENGKVWAPTFADVKVGASEIDPFTIGINTQITKDLLTKTVEFGGSDVYMRLIYVVDNKDQTVLFGVADSPQTKIESKRKK